MLNWLTTQWQNGATLASSCTGTFFLAKTGLLNNKDATTTWWLESQFRQMYPSVRLKPREVVTSQDRMVCAGAMASSLQMAMWILEKFGSDSLVSQCAKTMMIDFGRHVQPYSQNSLPHQATQDPVVSRAQYWLQNHLKSDTPMSQVAQHMGVSQRTMARKFKASLGVTPLAYLQSMRIEAAKNLLEASRVSIQDIVEEVGYKDYSAFTQLFRKQVGITPAAYRQMVSG